MTLKDRQVAYDNNQLTKDDEEGRHYQQMLLKLLLERPGTLSESLSWAQVKWTWGGKAKRKLDDCDWLSKSSDVCT